MTVSVAWIQLFNVYRMKSNTCIGFINCIGKSWIHLASSYLFIYHVDRDNAYANSQAVACDRCMARCSPSA